MSNIAKKQTLNKEKNLKKRYSNYNTFNLQINSTNTSSILSKIDIYKKVLLIQIKKI